MIDKNEIIKLIKEHPNYSQEKFFKKYFNEAYQEIQKNNFPDTFNFKQKIYHYLYDDMKFELGKCVCCGNRTKYRSFTYGYMKYCSIKCAGNDTELKQKIKSTNIERYGVSCTLNSDESIIKKKHTWMENYGCDNPAKNREIQEKIKNTNLEKYGVERPVQSKQVQNKIKRTNLNKYGTECALRSDEIQKKTKQTNIKRYGVEFPLQSNEIMEKSKNTCYSHYGVEFPLQSDILKNKQIQTNNDRYGTDFYMQTSEYKERVKQTNMDKYGVEHVFQAEQVKEKIKNTCLEKYGVEWFCMTQQARGRSCNSKPNLEFSKILDQYNIRYEREFSLEMYSYDFKINDILVEINPTITHNSYMSVYGGEPKPDTYHLNKSDCAEKNNYACIHVWDWDNIDKIINMLKPKETLYARKLTLKEVTTKECDEFLNLYHLQNTCKGQTLRYGLYKDNVLVQIMTFGKPRYNKNYEYELLRLCSHKDYIIVGGAEKLFKHFIKTGNPKSVISYCDKSKFNGNVYTKLEFSCNKTVNPSKHWYNMKTGQHITDNLLRQRGFDQLFNTNYGKGISNEELMISHSFLPVYDCGQMTFTWNLYLFYSQRTYRFLF